MKSITYNPYRIADLVPILSVRDILKQKQKLVRFLDVGKEISTINDYSFLPVINRTDENVLNAFSQLEQNDNKVLYALFWFIKDNAYDEIIISHLQKGNIEKVLEIWKSLVIDKEITEQNLASINNYATYLFVAEGKEASLRQGIQLKLDLIESPLFEKLVYKIADITYSFNPQLLQEKFVDLLVTDLEEYYQVSFIVNLFKNTAIHQYVIKKYISRPLRLIEAEIEENKKQLDQEIIGTTPYELGLKLYENTEDNIRLLGNILDITSFQYRSIADNLARQLMRCGVAQVNRDRASESYDLALYLLNKAQSIGVGSELLENIAENIESIEEDKIWGPIKEELEELVKKLEKFELDATFNRLTISDIQNFVGSCKPLLLILRTQLSDSSQEYINLSSSVAGRAFSALVSITNEAQEECLQQINRGEDKKKLLLSMRALFKQALDITDSISELSMTGELRSHIISNRQTIQNTYSSLSSNLPSEDDVSAFGGIIFFIFLVIIIILVFR